MRALRSNWLLLVPFSLAAYVGCSTDTEDLPPGQGGGTAVTGGAAGATAGSGGSTAGKGGSAGTGNTGNTAGASGAGAGGAGAGGAGAGGAGAGGAGAGGAGAGGAGAGGAGAGGAGAGGAGAGGAGAGGAGAGGAGAGGAGAGGAGAGGAGAAGSAGSAGGLTGTPEDKAQILAHLAITCADSVDANFYDTATPPSPWTAANRGDIVRCAYDRMVPKAEMDKHFVDQGAAPLGAETNVHKFRVVYWTERDGGKPAITSGSFYIPELRVASPSPLLSIGHGSVGLADKCAPSREDAEGFNDDWKRLAYQFVAHGWVSILPDYPGLGTPGPTAWDYSVDEGHSLLDATRAARKLTKSSFLSTKNAILGHSQGGHAALSAQSQVTSYGAEGTVETVVVYAPVWFSQASWGAEISSIALALNLVDTVPMLSSMMYFYGHSAALDGDAAALDAFLPTKGPIVKDFLENNCWNTIIDSSKWPASANPDEDLQQAVLAVAPATKPKGGAWLYQTTYTTEVGNCGALGNCSTALGATWKSRWTTDRPGVDPNVPIVLWAGGKDPTIPPSRQRCGVDRIKAQTTNFTHCGEADGTHQSIMESSGSWVTTHLRQKLLGGAAPAACVPYTDVVTVACATPPPNSLDPAQPLRARPVHPRGSESRGCAVRVGTGVSRLVAPRERAARLTAEAELAKLRAQLARPRGPQRCSGATPS